MDVEKKYRSKKFMSTDSLWYEEERRNTFIDWPVPFIASNELASNGFYYLRTKDHCACAFCLGIIGAWELGDSIHGEHKRHFPQCPFISGMPTPNVPLLHGNIISNFNLKNSCEIDKDDLTTPVGEDVCGIRCEDMNKRENFVSGGSETSNAALSSLGLQMYSGPRKREFLTYESRLSTYKDWPEKVAVTPQELADAGFFYIGLSDHVRCFHCGNGLRNWEPNDSAWEEHARWYPNCNFILLRKGTEFIDKVTRTNPPYIHTPPNQPSVYLSKGAKYTKASLTEAELSRLMDLEVIKAASEMGLSENAIKAALKKKLEQTGVPFFQLDQCVDAVLRVTEEELKAVEDESRSNQAEKMAFYHQNVTSSSTSEVAPRADVEASAGETPTSEEQQLQGPLEGDTESPSTRAISPLPVPSSYQLPADSVPSTSRQSAPVDDVQEDTMPAVVVEAAIPSVPSSSSEDLSLAAVLDRDSRNEESAVVTIPTIAASWESKEKPVGALESIPKEDLLAQADEIIKEAMDVLGKSSLSSSGNSSLESLDQIGENKIVDNSVNTYYLTKELERIKEVRTCRVCMDTEMEIVFLPCRHMTACASCAVTLSKCPICRANIQYAIKPIVS